MGDQLRRRVQARLDALSINVFEAERRAGFKRGFLNDLLIGKKSTLREKVIPALAAALECSPDYFGASAGALPGEHPSSTLAGIAELGAWREPEEAGVPDFPIPLTAPDPRYPADKVRMYLVRGDHAAGLGIWGGSIVSVLVDQGAYRDGDIVLAERTNATGAIETTIGVLTAGALSARPAKGPGRVVPASDFRPVGLVISSLRLFGLPN